MSNPAVLNPSDIVDAIREHTYAVGHGGYWSFDHDHAEAVAMVVTPLDLIWENVNALGGTPPCPVVAKALDIIESFGGSNPAVKRAALLPNKRAE